MIRLLIIFLLLSADLDLCLAASREPVRLNNFVTQLCDFNSIRETSCVVVNPRNGWIYIKAVPVDANRVVQLLSGSVAKKIAVDDDGEALTYLAKGEYSLAGNLSKVVIRAVPELLYANFEDHPLVSESGTFTWQWLEESGVLANTTTIVANGPGFEGSAAGASNHFYNEKPAPQWLTSGRRWIFECLIPGLTFEKGKKWTAQEIFEYYNAHHGMRSQNSGGIILDEFGGDLGIEQLQGLERIQARAKEDGKYVYPYFAGEPKKLLPLLAVSTKFGNKVVVERYLREQSNEQAEWEYLKRSYADYARQVSETGFEPNEMIFALGIMTTPNENTNVNPMVSFKSHLDMQFWLLANDPQLNGLYGLVEYLSKYADEEYLRWYAQLCRHYCIEGKKNRFSTDPYLLDHISNSDFAQSTQGWILKPAQEGTIATGKLDGLSWLQGRYPRTTEGDTYLLLKSSTLGHNRIEQKIRNLVPGRFYSVKLYSCDVSNRYEKSVHNINVDIDGAEHVPSRSFVHVFHNCYDHWIADEDKKQNRLSWFNYKFTVFKAVSKEAVLIVADVPDSGQSLAVNFIEVEPYFMPRR
jgi:hypothetical protein